MQHEHRGGVADRLVAPDEKTFEWIEGRPRAPEGAEFARAVTCWRTLASDPDAEFDREVKIDAPSVAPQVSWGTSPDQVASIVELVPADAHAKALAYMGLTAGQPLEGLAIDHVFIGSRTNRRIEDLRIAAAIADGRHVADGVRAMVVPGSGLVKRQAEAEGLRTILEAAGFEWRDSGCSLCVAMNDDRLKPGERRADHREAGPREYCLL